MRAVRSARRHIVMVKIRLLDLKKVFVAESADAHSKAKMYGCFEPIHSMKSMLGPEER